MVKKVSSQPVSRSRSAASVGFMSTSRALMILSITLGSVPSGVGVAGVKSSLTYCVRPLRLLGGVGDWTGDDGTSKCSSRPGELKGEPRVGGGGGGGDEVPGVKKRVSR